MSEEPNETDDRLEGMLRRWGAGEAAARTRPGQMPPQSTQPVVAATVVAAPPASVQRWLPLAAAAMVVMALIAGFFVGTRSGPDGPMVASPQAQLDRGAPLRRELAALKEALAAANRDLEEANHLIRTETEAADKARQELEGALAAVTEESQAAADARKRADALAIRNKTLDDAVVTLEQRTKNLQLATEKAQAQVRTLQKGAGDLANLKAEFARLKLVDRKLAAATGDLRRVQKLYEDALGEANRTQAKLAALKSKPVIEWNSFRTAYLAAAAPGQTGLRALQIAVGRTRMLPRCAELRKTARTMQTRRLLDQLEVVLTRLVMLAIGDFEGKNSFMAMLRNGKYLERIDEALESASLPPATRGWLIEAKLVLGGVPHVG